MNTSIEVYPMWNHTIISIKRIDLAPRSVLSCKNLSAHILSNFRILQNVLTEWDVNQKQLPCPVRGSTGVGAKWPKWALPPNSTWGLSYHPPCLPHGMLRTGSKETKMLTAMWIAEQHRLGAGGLTSRGQQAGVSWGLSPSLADGCPLHVLRWSPSVCVS